MKVLIFTSVKASPSSKLEKIASDITITIFVTVGPNIQILKLI